VRVSISPIEFHPFGPEFQSDSIQIKSGWQLKYTSFQQLVLKLVLIE